MQGKNYHTKQEEKRTWLVFPMGIKIGVCNDLENKNDRHAKLKFEMLALVPDYEDTYQCSNRSANDGKPQKRGFRDAPSVPFGFDFVDDVSHQCDGIDDDEIVHGCNRDSCSHF
ncbi:hypothetical protein HMPREF1870_02190 [Bacteroidales bacterium KA00344]|nr:hypothetical protein HMPREF1870_02190 [Bacteroidales bacterium KA00344]